MKNILIAICVCLGLASVANAAPRSGYVVPHYHGHYHYHYAPFPYQYQYNYYNNLRFGYPYVTPPVIIDYRYYYQVPGFYR